MAARELTILHTPDEMRAWRKSVSGARPASGFTGSAAGSASAANSAAFATTSSSPSAQVGFVPTMGALHAGHADLLRRMRARMSAPGDRLVLSIFVNPTQFGPGEDLSKYPRTLESDLALARQCGVDAVYFPSPADMYPKGYSTYVEETALTGSLCGAHRPGHFRGVTTVVLKLFNLVRPDVAYFGLKDAQQFFVLHKMARDLDLDVSIEGIPTVREPDGLALSSRNVYLSPDERERAPAIYRELKRVAGATSRSISFALSQARERLSAQGFRVQYLEARALPGFEPAGVMAAETLSAETPTPEAPTADGARAQPILIAVAAHLGPTRLIDNVILHPDRLRDLGIVTHSP